MADNADTSKLDLGETAENSYIGLARKYRPQHFGDLVGQDAMVRTLQNAFKSGRIAHAFMLTGVRGVGKTTTARILARALNYAPVDNSAVKLEELDFSQALPMGAFCQDIMQGRLADVIEMDAASHGGIDDIRELIGNAHYRPIAARFKVYIIDEVHMLSTEAFNGLLKTLEEPPPHVKFIFATTEIRKVPVTILSRCQRFDLRRLDAETAQALLKKVCEQEEASLPDEVLALLARAADGSARDGLSLLDRVLAHYADNATAPSADDVRELLGLADRARLFDLFALLVEGKLEDALRELHAQYATGADASSVLAELAILTHWVGRLKFIPETESEIGVSQEQRKQAETMATTLSVPELSRLWQLLLKGHQEVSVAPLPLAAAEMVLIRLCHLTTQPTPAVLVKQWEAQETKPAPASPAPTSAPAPAQESKQEAPQDAPQENKQENNLLAEAKSAFPEAEVVKSGGS